MRVMDRLIVITILVALILTFPLSSGKTEGVPVKSEGTHLICQTTKVMKSTNNIILSCSKIDEVESNG